MPLNGNCMPQLIFKIADTFTIEGRGVCASPGEWGDGKADLGDSIELRRPDGSALRASIRELTYPHRDILLPAGITRSDIPAGTEIWTVDD
jgi:hypothetical protein